MRFTGLLAFIACASAWNAGVGVRDISPSATELATQRIFLGGYGALGFRDGQLGFARGVHDPVWARAFCLEDSQRSTIVSVVIDAAGVGNLLVDAIRNGSASATGIPRERIMVSATHSHCAPDLQGLWAGVTPSYRQFVIRSAIEAVTEAYRSRVAADVFVSGRDPGAGYNSNRRGWSWTVNTTTIIDAFQRGTNRRIGSLLNFGAHPVTLGASMLEMSSDFAHYLRVRFERSSGAPLVWVNGAIGDVSPACPGCPGGGLARTEAFGNRIADLAQEIMRERVPLEDGITFRTTQFQQPVTNLIFFAAWAAGLLNGYYDIPDQGGSLFMPIDLGSFRLGRNNANSIDVVTFPGESLSRNAFPVQNAMTARFSMLFGLTWETVGYLVPTDEWRRLPNGRDYEENISLEEKFGDNVRDRLINMIRGSVDNSEANKFATQGASVSSAEQQQLYQSLRLLAKELVTAMPSETQSTPHFFIEQLNQLLMQAAK